jgi:integrase
MRFKTILWKHTQHKDGTHPLKVYVYAQGKVRYYPIGLNIKEGQWDELRQKVRPGNPFTAVYNDQIVKFRHKVEEHFLSGGTHEEMVHGKKIKKASLTSFIEELIAQIDQGKVNIKKSTGKNYASLLSRLRGYAKYTHRKDIFFSDIDMEFYHGLIGYLTDQCNCNIAGCGKHIKNLKSVMNKGLERNLHDNHKHRSKEFRTIRTKPNKIYLTESEISAMQKLDLKDSPSLERERDRFMICYFLLLRFSDCAKIRRDAVFVSKGKKYIRINHEKTDREVIVPLKQEAALLLEKYDFKLDYTANQIANRSLKIIASMANINEPTTESGRILPKSQFVTTHTARRSAATNLFSQGVSLKTIADLGGWQNLKTLMVYLKTTGMDSARIASDLDFFT